MKLVALCALWASCALCNLTSLSAQDAPAISAALAAAKGAEEGYQRLNAVIEQLTENYALQQKKFSGLAEEINRLRDENARHAASASDNATKEELRKLAEKVQEIDQKRESDKKLILEEIQKLAKVPVVAALPDRKVNHHAEKVETNENFYTYTVKQGETLSEIIKAYNEAPENKGKTKLTIDQVKRANPRLDPNLLRPGKEILIPMPASK